MKRPSLQSILQVDDSYHSKFQYIHSLYDTKYSKTTVCKNRITGEMTVLKENTDMTYFYQLRREIMIIRQLNHDGIISIKDSHINEDLNKCYIVLPYFKNGDLFDFYQKNPSLFTIGKILEIIRKLIEIVKYCHEKGICHRDIKAENILLNNDFNTYTSITLIDFGLSIQKKGDIFSIRGECGSPNYMAPEINSKNIYNESCDVWSIGILFYFLMYGDYPDVKQSSDFQYPISQKVTEEIKDLLQKLLDKNPTTRISLHDALCHKCFVYAA